jgi:hypothetical protein
VSQVTLARNKSLHFLDNHSGHDCGHSGSAKHVRYKVAPPARKNLDNLLADRHDPPPLKWSDLRYVFDIKEDCNGKEAIQA